MTNEREMNPQTPRPGGAHTHQGNSFDGLFRRVKSALKLGNFGDDLRNDADELNIALAGEASIYRGEGTEQYFEAKSLVAEVYDYFGNRSKAKNVVLKEGMAVYNDLPRQIPEDTAIEARTLLRAKIRFVLYYAQAVYRDNKYEDARKIIVACKELLKAVQNDKLPCFGTRGQLHYYLGRVYRHMNDLEASEEEFTESLTCYCRRAEHKKDEYLRTCKTEKERNRRIQETVNFTNHKVAKCMSAGLAWIDYTRGYFRRALKNILAARVLLMPTGDELNKGRLNLLEGACLRALAGRTPAELKPAVELIEKAYSIFAKDFDHPHYEAKAAYELALAYLYSKEFKRANEFRLEVDRFGKKDANWACHGKILASRIYLEQGGKSSLKEAEEFASAAIAQAKKDDLAPCLIDALISRARVRLEMNDKDKNKGAKEDFQLALDLNVNKGIRLRSGAANPKMASVCHIGLVLLNLRESDVTAAQNHYNRWLEIRPTLEHGAIQGFGREADQALKAALNSDFLIRADSESLDYRNHVKKLQDFLLMQAKKRPNSDSMQKVAKILGISRQTIYEWSRNGNDTGGDKNPAVDQDP